MSQPTTAYYRLQAQLEKIIKATPNGEKLPSEPKLAKTLKVSRATLREAMRIYEVQGLIRRKQGIGTFVVASPQIIESGLEALESIETLAEHIGMDVTMGDLEITHFKADATQAEILDLSVDAALITIKRVIKTDNRPVAFLIDTLPEHILTPADLDGGFTGSVLDLLLHRGDPALSISKTEISASPAPIEVA
ncbi:MAG: GntR family transcriptional regulator, partial [Chloroflexota bacterium]